MQSPCPSSLRSQTDALRPLPGRAVGDQPLDSPSTPRERPRRGGYDPDTIDQIFVGNCIPGAFEAASVTGRQIGLKLGIDKFTTTVDTACCSPLTALRLARWAIGLGEARAALVVGVESMSRVPHLSRQLRAGVRIGEVKLIDPIFPITYPGYSSVAVDASDGAERYGVPKRMLDAFAMGSHLKWADAARAGKFTDEIAPIRARKGRGEALVTEDEQPRPDGSVARISMLPPVFGSKTTTPGNAPGLNDGATAMVVMSEERAKELGVGPGRARRAGQRDGRPERHLVDRPSPSARCSNAPACASTTWT